MKSLPSDLLERILARVHGSELERNDNVAFGFAQMREAIGDRAACCSVSKLFEALIYSTEKCVPRLVGRLPSLPATGATYKLAAALERLVLSSALTCLELNIAGDGCPESFAAAAALPQCPGLANLTLRLLSADERDDASQEDDDSQRNDGPAMIWVTPELGEAIAQCSQLTALTLCSHDGKAGIELCEGGWLGKVLRRLPALEELRCYGVTVIDDGRAIRDALPLAAALTSIVFCCEDVPLDFTFFSALPKLRRLHGMARYWDRASYALMVDDHDLESLDLSGVGESGALRLAVLLPQLPRLRDLELTNCRITPTGFSALGAALPSMSALTGLFLGSPCEGDDGVESLVVTLSRCPCLRKFALDSHVAYPAWVEALGAVLPFCGHLTALILSGLYELEGEDNVDLRAVFAALPGCRQLAELQLKRINLGVVRVALLFKHLQRVPSLTNLTLKDTCAGAEDSQTALDFMAQQLSCPNVLIAEYQG